MVTVFQEQGVHSEALNAARLFQEAAEQERARARHEAGLRFEG